MATIEMHQRRSAMKSTRILAAAGMSLGVVAALQTGCAGPAKVAQEQKATQAPEQQEVRTVSGKVVETTTSGPYTYLCVEKDGKQIWAAVPDKVKATVGQQITLRGMVVVNFTSKSLNKKFDEIIFSDGEEGSDKSNIKHKMLDQPNATVGTENITGKVAETINSGGYTYVKLEQEGKTIWIAIPQTDVKVGQNIVAQPGMEMKSFKSKSLGRTFDSVYFSGGLVQAPPIAPGTSLPAGHPKIEPKDKK